MFKIKLTMKIIVLALFLSLPFLAMAQFSKGQVYLGGTLSLNSTTPSYPGLTVNLFNSVVPKSSSVSISPLFGWFVNEKFLVGAEVGYSNTYLEYDYVPASYGFQKDKSYAIILSSFGRYYVPISSSFYFATQGGIYFSRANSTSINNNGVVETTTESPYYSVGITFKPMLVFFPSPKWGVEASVGTLGYSYKRYLPDAYSTSSFAFNAGSFSLGLGYYFGRTEK
jgi:hypothetical protein